MQTDRSKTNSCMETLLLVKGIVLIFFENIKIYVFSKIPIQTADRAYEFSAHMLAIMYFSLRVMNLPTCSEPLRPLEEL